MMSRRSFKVLRRVSDCTVSEDFRNDGTIGSLQRVARVKRPKVFCCLLGVVSPGLLYGVILW